MTHYTKCPMCGGRVRSELKFGAGLHFTSFDDHYQSCTDCSWDERKHHDFDITDG